MTAVEGVVDELILLGYVAVGRYGFALPCFAYSPMANAWYAATPSVDSDHGSIIAGFEPLEPDELINSLPVDQRIPVKVGDPWQDVFLWDGRVYAGAPAAIYELLESERRAISESAPLSLLDLALSVEAPETPALAADAVRFLENRYGPLAAAEWHERLIVIPGVRLAVRRVLSSETLVLRNVRISREEDHALVVELPEDTTRVLNRHDALDTAKAAIERFGDSIGARIKVIAPSVRAAVERTSDRPLPAETPDQANGNILIVATGRRARAVVRHFDHSIGTAPGEPKEPDYELVRIGATNSFDMYERGRPQIHFADGVSPSAELSTYRVIVWILDDEEIDSGGTSRIAELGRWGEQHDTILLVAPVLPAREPSRLVKDDSFISDLGIDALIDTSLARSPFWAGAQRHSFDRRMADIILLSSRIAAVDSGMWKAVKRSAPRYEPLILCAQGGGSSRHVKGSGMASELSAPVGNRRESNPIHRAEFALRTASASSDQIGVAELRRFAPDFPGFVRAVVHDTFNIPDGAQSQSDLPRPVPRPILDRLRYPDMAAGIPLFDRRGVDGVVICAEAPHPKVLRAAQQHGWAAIRYTDRQTLKVAFGGKENFTAELPREIGLPHLHRFLRNRGLAARGVDPRDIVRVPLGAWEELAGKHADSPLIDAARRYLPSSDVRAAEFEIALPLVQLRDEGSRGDLLAGDLVREFGDQISRYERSGKRPADLRNAWTPPGDGARRFVIEDGHLPVQMIELQRGEVPAQRMFIVDGDGSVPVLFTSRLFSVWARATLPATTSWSARFQVGQTFEAFPLSHQFVVYHGSEGQSQLRISDDPGALEQFSDLIRNDAQELSDMLQLRSHSDRPQLNDPLIREIERALLIGIGLGSEASDLDILERLIEMNRNADTK